MCKEFVKRSKECKSIEEMLAKDGPMNFMFKDMIQALLQAEMTDHLGYGPSDARLKNTDNSRNGSYKVNRVITPHCLFLYE
jgi:transposase-like protein